MVARGLSAEWVPLPLLSPSEMLYAGAQMLRSVCDTHMHAQSDAMVAQVLIFPSHYVYLGLCVCYHLHAFKILWRIVIVYHHKANLFISCNKSSI